MSHPVFVIVVTYNGRSHIQKCLSSIFLSDVHVRVLLIDNGSIDGTVDLVKKEYPDVQIMQSQINHGFGKGNNIGIKYAYECGAEQVFLLNQDAWVNPDTIRILRELQEKNKSCAIISPLQFDGTGLRLDKKFARHLSKSIVIDDFISDCITDRQKDYYIVEYTNAAAWLISRECIESVGLFNPEFYHYGEDWEYLQRVHKKGLRVGLSTKAMICHNRDQNANENIYDDRKKMMHYRAYVKYILSRLNHEVLWNILSSLKYIMTRPGSRVKLALMIETIKDYSSIISTRSKGYKSEKAFFEDTEEFRQT